MNDQESLTLLLIEEDEDSVNHIQSMLKMNNRFVHHFNHIKNLDYLNDTRVEKTDIILLSLDLNDKKTHECINKIHRNFKKTPIIALSSEDEETCFDKVLDFKIDELLSKQTLSSHSLITTILNNVKKKNDLIEINEDSSEYKKEIDQAKIQLINNLLDSPFQNETENKLFELNLTEIINRFINQKNKLEHMAHYDPVTELPNRVFFEEMIKKSVARAKRHEHKIALLYIEFSQIDTIIDSLGEYSADLTLKESTERMTLSLRTNDFMARIGENLIAIIVDEITATEDAGIVARKISEIIHAPYHILGNTIVLNSYIGISCFPETANDAYELIKNAHTALDQAKKIPHANYQYYSSELNENYTRRLTLENALNFALHQNEFFLVYQPSFNLETNEIRSIEVFIRWNHPELGLISPMEFLPIAERIGIIQNLTEWIFETAIQQYSKWYFSGNCNEAKLSINLSARQLCDHNLIRIIKKSAERSNIPLSQLILELTELILLNESNGAEGILKNLGQLGLKISIDDFGTGYSSISKLKQLPIDILKIDTSFLRDMCNDENGEVILKSIIQLGKSLGLDVIAVGIETKEQLKLLREQNCPQGQGYYFCKPLKANEIKVYLDDLRN